MNRRFKLALLIAIIGVVPHLVSAQYFEEAPQKASFKDRIFVGGGFGLSFGTITYVSLSPIVGYKITQRWAAGVGISYQYRNDKRFVPALTTNDYGGSLFTRYLLIKNIFAEARYEVLNFEYLQSPSETARKNYDSFLLGGGFSQPLGKKASFVVSIMYNLLYDDLETPRPYNSPLVVNVGVSAGL